MLRDSVRTYYYQRSGTPITEKYGGKWHHRGGHLGPSQDRAARYSQGGKALGQPRELLGGWFDAGDLNKYVPYLETTLFDLLWAYELNPGVFGDDTNIPESGNGVPDLVDELKWELDWLLKMQDTDGGVFNRVAGRSFDNGPDPPGSDNQPRFYTAKTTWATATASAGFAHAARVYDRFDRHFPGYAARMRAHRGGDGLTWRPTLRCIPPTVRTATKPSPPHRLPVTPTPTADLASMPPRSCSRRSESRASRLTSTGGQPMWRRPRKTASIQ